MKVLGTTLLLLSLAAPAFAGNGQIGSFSLTDATNLKRKKVIGEQCVSMIAPNLPKSIYDVCAKRCERNVTVEYDHQSCGHTYTEAKPGSNLNLGLGAGALFQMSGGEFAYLIEFDCTTGKLVAQSGAPIHLENNGKKDGLDVNTTLTGADQIQVSYDAKTKSLKLNMKGLTSGKVADENVAAEQGLKSLEYLPLDLELNYVFDGSVKNSAEDEFPIAANSSFTVKFSPEFIKAAGEKWSSGDVWTSQLRSTIETNFSEMFFDSARSKAYIILQDEERQAMMEKTSAIDWAGLDAFFTDLAKLQSSQKESSRGIEVLFNHYGKVMQNAQCMTVQ